MRNRTLLGLGGALVVSAVWLGFVMFGATPSHTPDAATSPTTPTVTLPSLNSRPAPEQPFAPRPGYPTASGEEGNPHHTGNPTSIDLTQYSVDDPNSIWVIVNKARPLEPKTFVPKNLVSVRGILVNEVSADDLKALLDAADSAKLRLGIRTAYRDYGSQQHLLNKRIAVYGRERAEQGTARPGHTEHQTGLAVDFVARNRSSCDLRACFGQTPESGWLAEHAWEFGFIQRYTEQNTDVTGFMAESWHYRYVGRELAEYLHTSEVGSLEELFGVAGGGEYLD